MRQGASAARVRALGGERRGRLHAGPGATRFPRGVRAEGYADGCYLLVTPGGRALLVEDVHRTDAFGTPGTCRGWWLRLIVGDRPRAKFRVWQAGGRPPELMEIGTFPTLAAAKRAAGANP